MSCRPAFFINAAGPHPRGYSPLGFARGWLRGDSLLSVASLGPFPVATRRSALPRGWLRATACFQRNRVAHSRWLLAARLCLAAGYGRLPAFSGIAWPISRGLLAGFGFASRLVTGDSLLSAESRGLTPSGTCRSPSLAAGYWRQPAFSSVSASLNPEHIARRRGASLHDTLRRMKLEPFAMERMQSIWENQVALNLSESGVHPLRVEELAETDDESRRRCWRSRSATRRPTARSSCARRSPRCIRAPRPITSQVTNGGSEANFITLCTSSSRATRW